MFSGCMIGGSLYGTGRRFKDLDAHQRVTAMEVGTPIPFTLTHPT